MTKLNLASFISLVALVAAAAIGCGSAAVAPEPSFEVDSSVRPVDESITFADGTGERPLASITDDKGRQIDFVEDEVVLALRDRSALPAILERLQGRVLREIDPVSYGAPDDTPKFVLLKIDPRHAEPAELAGLILASEGENGASHRVSSQQALDALTAMARESTDEGTQLGANFLFRYDGLSERETLEAPSGGRSDYTQDAFQLPYMSRGSRQDIGAAEAARMVHDAGRVPAPAERVDFMIMDGGFLNLSDFPAATILPVGAFGLPNPNDCSGGNPCPWHGTQVASSALSIFDNGIGAAGPASEVVHPIFVQSPNPNLWDYLEYIFETIPRALGHFPDIVNVSASGGIPAGLCLVGVCTAVDIAGTAVRGAGILVFASAGNDGADVDDEDCFLGCWEGEYRVPCEAPGVVCVGGLAHDAVVKDPDSAYGSKQRSSSGSVDIYAPFSIWVHETPAGSDAELKNGTSFSSPFTAAVAALVKAANPSLGPGAIWDILRDSAHTFSSGTVHRWVNAYGAVHAALGGNAPPFVQVDSPTDGAAFAVNADGVPLVCDVSDEDGMDGVSISWSSDRDGDVGARSRWTSVSTLSEGTHQITCTASDGSFEVSDTVTVQVVNEAPSIQVEQPFDAARYYASEPIAVSARASDRNGNLAGVSWELSSIVMLTPGPFGDPIPVPFSHWTGTGLSQTIPGGFLSPGTYQLTATAVDTRGESASDTIEVVIELDASEARPVISNPSVTAIPADPNDGPPSYFWVDQCLVDVTGDGLVNSADDCQRLHFAAEVTDLDDPPAALTYEWTVTDETGTPRGTQHTSGPSLTLDLEPGSYRVTLVVTDPDGHASNPYMWRFDVATLI